MPIVELYSRTGCHLCEIAKAKITELRRSAEFLFVEIDIQENPELFEKYRESVPVILVNGTVFSRYDVNPDELLLHLVSLN
jgi:glutaredoxin